MIPVQNIEGIQVPEFDAISPADWDLYLSRAYERAIEDGDAISKNAHSPTFENTFLEMERRTRRIWEVVAPFSTIQNAHSTEEMQALAKKWMPKFKDIENRFLNADLAHRCQVALDGALDLDSIDRRLAEETLLRFKTAGAFLGPDEQARFLDISRELSELGLEFAEIHQSNSNRSIRVNADLPGVDPVFAAQAREAAQAQGDHQYARIGVNASEVETVLSQCSDRTTREQVWNAFAGRGLGVFEGDTSTQPITSQILALRSESAALLGYDNWAELATSQKMARTPQNAHDLVCQTWRDLLPVLNQEIETIQNYANTHGFEGALEPWDIDYWLAQTRAEHFSIDEESVRKHLPLSIVRAGAFASAESLFGITFEAVSAPTYHPDAAPFLVRDRDGSALGLLYIDDAIRETKSSGAWMEMLVSPDRIDGGRLPVIVNVCNFPSSTEERPALLSMEEAVTAFHELGHALHGLLTTARYPSQAGTMVYGDFVELQSQLLENWIREPEALTRIGMNWESGEKMDAALAKRIESAMQFGQSIEKSRYLISAWLDIAAHTTNEDLDPENLERAVSDEMKAPDAITARHRLPHFTHLFAGSTGGEYSAGYYSYLWAEVLEADAFEAWKEGGNLFDEALGQKVRDTIYARGNEVAPDELYRMFRGRDPDPAALLRRLGASNQAVEPPRSHSIKM